MTARPDPFIHPITRLSICGLLASGADWVEFAAVRNATGISDSVLSKQSVALEEAGYVQVRKGAVGRRPRTWFRLTARGRRALADHLAWLAQLEESISASARDEEQPTANSATGQTAQRAAPAPTSTTGALGEPAACRASRGARRQRQGLPTRV